MSNVILRAVARAVIGGGGGIFVYSCYARRISFEKVVFKLISKEISRAEHEYMNTPPPPINALATALVILYLYKKPTSYMQVHNVGKPPEISTFAKNATENVLGHGIFVYTIWGTLKSGTVNVANNV